MMRNYLASQININALTNILLLPYQPRELMPEIIAFSDIQFIFMEPKIAAQGFPSKVYTIMASAKPLLVCSPQNTPIINFLSEIGCAKIITSSDVSDKAKRIVEWLSNVSKANLKKMGENGFTEIKNKYSKDIVTKQYCDLIHKL